MHCKLVANKMDASNCVCMCFLGIVPPSITKEEKEEDDDGEERERKTHACHNE